MAIKGKINDFEKFLSCSFVYLQISRFVQIYRRKAITNTI